MADITYLGGDSKKSGAPALPAGTSTAVHCLMIPLQSDILLLPNAAIAEVAAYQNPQSVNGSPDWYLGKHGWRDYQIPLLSFEKLNDGLKGELSLHKNSRIAVLNTLNGNMQLPYIGLLTQGIPRLQVVQTKSLQSNAAAASRPGDYVAEFVLVNGEPVTIPNIDLIEQTILDLSL